MLNKIYQNEEIKFSEEEVSEINKLRGDVASVFNRLGQLEIERKRRIDEVEEIKNTLLDEHQQLQEKEQQLFTQLNTKYGDGNYNPDTNVFTPSEKEEESAE